MIQKLLDVEDDQLQLLLIMPTADANYLNASTCREDAQRRFAKIKENIVKILVLPENVRIEKELKEETPP